MNKRILVPLDGSSLSEMVLPHATALAHASNYGLTLLRVATSPSSRIVSAWGAAPTPAVDVSEGWDEELQAERDYLGMVAERLRPAVLDVQIQLVEGEPDLGIISYAEQHPEVALIAMSTHGRSGLSRWVFGSVAEKVLHAAPVPLLLVRPKQGKELPTGYVPEYRSLLVPLDGSVFADQALNITRTLAASLHAKVTLVSSVPEMPLSAEMIPPSAVPAAWTDETEVLTAHLEQSRRRLVAEGVAVETRLEYGAPAEAILRVAETTHPDLIVMATHGRTGLPRLWLGSIAMKVVEASTHPVLLVHSKERIREPEPARAKTRVIPAF